MTIPKEDMDKHRATSKVTLDALGNPTHAYVFNQFTPSVTSRMIRVDYSLKCFVKYDSWEARGEGKVVTLPIKIFQEPVAVQVPFKLDPVAGFEHLEEPIISFVEPEASDPDGYEKAIVAQEVKWNEQLSIAVGEAVKETTE